LKEAGLINSELDISNHEEKQFYTYWKSKVENESVFGWYNPLNLINNHHIWYGNDWLKELKQIELIKWIYLARPSVVLSLDNEYLTWKLFEELSGYYKGSA